MKFVIAPTAFKGTLTPGEAAEAMAAGIRRRHPGADLDIVPISDGGDGFLECLSRPLAAERRSVIVRGPVHAPVAAPFGLTQGGTAVVEAALAVGLALLAPGSLDAIGATSGGLGELLAEARQAGAAEILLGLGGSASTDGGTGMARALGYRFLDESGAELPEGGGYLHRLARIDPSLFDPGWLMLPIRVACDVDNQLLGPDGSAATFGPQKGATPDQVRLLEAGLRRLAEVLRRDLGVDVSAMPFAGSAGGLGAGLSAFLGAELTAGAALVLDEVGFGRRLDGAQALLTGEGRLDGQSLHGKAPVVAGRRARARGLRATALVGTVGEGWRDALGDAFDDVVALPAAAVSRAGAADRLSAAAALLEL